MCFHHLFVLGTVLIRAEQISSVVDLMRLGSAGHSFVLTFYESDQRVLSIEFFCTKSQVTTNDRRRWIGTKTNLSEEMCCLSFLLGEFIYVLVECF